MSHTFKPISLDNLKTYSLLDRNSKVSVDDFAKVHRKNTGFQDFLDHLPNILAASDIKSVISTIATAYRNQHTVLWAMGAHVIKVGLNPVIIDLMERGVITGIAMNGAGIIHDFEIAFTGQTSEDVAAALGDGSFGMAAETGEFLCRAIAEKNGKGLGESVGEAILENALPHADRSILAAGARLNIPVTVHVAVGTDIIHMSPHFDPAQAGIKSHRDFRTFAAIVATLENGVYMNIGSAVILPEIFLKAITLIRNKGGTLDRFTTVNMDFIRQYRPLTNVVQRPTAKGGQGINLVGCHEIMLPLIAAGIIESIG